MRPRVAIVGAGITGLTAAYYLEKSGSVEVQLFDPAPGGKLQTEVVGDLTLDLGPDAIFARKPAALEFIRELGLEDELIEPQARSFSIFVDGALHTVPAGLISLTSLDAASVEAATFLSAEGKRRVLAEPSIPALDGEDESIASFFRRRFGVEFSRKVAEPLLAGTHGGNAENLSMAALYPAHLRAERSRGAGDGSDGSDRVSTGPTFVSFRGGLGAFSDLLVSRIGSEIVPRAVSSLVVRERRAVLDDRFEADHVLLAIPADRAAPLLPAIPFASIPHASSLIVTFAFSGLEPRPSGSGFLVVDGEDVGISGATWTSNKWTDRSPSDVFLVRVFLSRSSGSLSDDEALRVALDGLLVCAGITASPSFSRVIRWTSALPQYEVGHLALARAIRKALLGSPITVAGTSYDGVGIPDCIRQGKAAALSILERLGAC